VFREPRLGIYVLVYLYLIKKNNKKTTAAVIFLANILNGIAGCTVGVIAAAEHPISIEPETTVTGVYLWSVRYKYMFHL